MQFNEPDWIRGEPRNHFMFETMLSFLHDASNLSVQTSTLASAAVNALFITDLPNPSVDEYRQIMRIFFAILFTIVIQIDADAVEQDHLAEFVLTIRGLPFPATVAQEMDPESLDSNMNEDLSKFVNVWSKAEIDAPLHPRLADRQGMASLLGERTPWQLAPDGYLTGQAWASASAFAARVHTCTAHQERPRLDVRGLLALIEALERPLTPDQLEDVLPAAASWMVYAGKALKDNNVPYARYDIDDDAKRSAGSKGELWNGQHAFNPARWEFWVQRFKEISEQDDISGTVRDAALQAFQAGSQ